MVSPARSVARRGVAPGRGRGRRGARGHRARLGARWLAVGSLGAPLVGAGGSRGPRGARRRRRAARDRVGGVDRGTGRARRDGGAPRRCGPAVGCRHSRRGADALPGAGAGRTHVRAPLRVEHAGRRDGARGRRDGAVRGRRQSRHDPRRGRVSRRVRARRARDRDHPHARRIGRGRTGSAVRGHPRAVPVVGRHPARRRAGRSRRRGRPGGVDAAPDAGPRRDVSGLRRGARRPFDRDRARVRAVRASNGAAPLARDRDPRCGRRDRDRGDTVPARGRDRGGPRAVVGLLRRPRRDARPAGRDRGRAHAARDDDGRGCPPLARAGPRRPLRARDRGQRNGPRCQYARRSRRRARRRARRDPVHRHGGLARRVRRNPRARGRAGARAARAPATRRPGPRGRRAAVRGAPVRRVGRLVDRRALLDVVVPAGRRPHAPRARRRHGLGPRPRSRRAPRVLGRGGASSLPPAPPTASTSACSRTSRSRSTRHGPIGLRG